MIVTCPHCGTTVWPSPQGLCPACQQPISCPESVDAVLGDVESLPSGVPAPPTTPDVDVRGRRRGLLAILSLGLLCLVLAVECFTATGNALSYGLLVYLALILALQIRLFLWPPRLQLREGVLEVRGLISFRVPAQEVQDLRMVNVCVQVQLHRSGAVSPAGMQPVLDRHAAKEGCHYRLPAGSFTLQQLNQVRQALGLAPLVKEDDPALAFEATLKDLTPYAAVTPALILANVLLFAAMLFADDRQPGPLEWTMIDWGANLGAETTAGQWWRLGTSMFLHFNLLHLAFNMWILWDIGRLVERLLGNAAFLIVYLAAGFLGSAASAWWHENALSAGASGAVFGLFGALLGFLLPRRQSIPAEVIKRHRSSVVAFLVFNLLLGLSIPWIDMAAHVGGLVAGLVGGLLTTQELSPGRRLARRLRTALVVLVAAAGCAGAVYSLPQRSARIMSYRTRTDVVDVWSFSTLRDFSAQQRRGALSASQAAQEIEQQIVAAYERLERELASFRTEPRHEAERQRLTAYVRLRREGLQLIAAGVRNDNLAKQGLALEKLDAARDLFAKETGWRPAGTAPPDPDLVSVVARFAVVESQVLQRFQEIVATDALSAMTDIRRAEAIEREVLEPWRSARERFRLSSRTLPPEHRATIERLDEYMRLREQSWGLLIEGMREGNQKKVTQSQQLSQEADSLARRIGKPSEN